ncbi:hypothetical protein B0H14DRAFT_2577432 [Mycena olivaceomarginata]|nr:hypothetical protein B0H14DRAFT_2577432 [Mycena olivaceomarginata]
MGPEAAEAQEHLVKTLSPGTLPGNDNETVAHLPQATRAPPRTLERLDKQKKLANDTSNNTSGCSLSTSGVGYSYKVLTLTNRRNNQGSNGVPSIYQAALDRRGACSLASHEMDRNFTHSIDNDEKQAFDVMYLKLEPTYEKSSNRNVLESSTPHERNRRSTSPLIPQNDVEIQAALEETTGFFTSSFIHFIIARKVGDRYDPDMVSELKVVTEGALISAQITFHTYRARSIRSMLTN